MGHVTAVNDVRHISTYIARPPADVYELIRQPGTSDEQLANDQAT